MSDVMKIATERKSELEKMIGELESEISEIREEMATLDDFLEFGASLMGDESKPSAPAAKPSAPQTKEAAPAAKSEAGGLPRLDGKKAVDPFDQPNTASVAELRPTQRPVSRPV